MHEIMCLLYLLTMEASDSQELRLLHRIEWKSDQDVLTETETLWRVFLPHPRCVSRSIGGTDWRR